MIGDSAIPDHTTFEIKTSIRGQLSYVTREPSDALPDHRFALSYETDLTRNSGRLLFEVLISPPGEPFKKEGV